MRKQTKTLYLLFMALPVATAQPFSFGVKGGIPLTDAFTFGSVSSGGIGVNASETYFSKTKRYTVGPTIEFHLPAHLSMEFDALYKHLNYDRTDFEETPSSGSHGAAIRNVLGRWEFPLLLKYRRWSNRLSPYIAAGPTLNYISGNHSIIERFGQSVFGPPTSSITTTSNALPAELRRVHTGGVAVAAGLVPAPAPPPLAGSALHTVDQSEFRQLLPPVDSPVRSEPGRGSGRYHFSVTQHFLKLGTAVRLTRKRTY
jgi:hypothetical protein